MFRAVLAFAIALVCPLALCQDTRQGAETDAKGKFASDLDRQVLQALLLSACEDAEFPLPATPDKTIIVLHERTPKLIDPVINTALVMNDTGGKVMPKDAWDDLVRRNSIRRNPLSREISYDGLSFDPRIAVGNAYPDPDRTFVGKSFDQAFPNGRGWVDAWVPGYSKDGKTAVVRARIGPTTKWTTLTAILNKKDDNWVVTWRRYSTVN